MAVPAETIDFKRERWRCRCDAYRQGVADQTGLLIDLYESRDWEAMGYETFREGAVEEFGEHQRTMYRRLEAALVLRELGQTSDPVFDKFVKNEVSEHSLRALAKAPEGTRAEVLKIAERASDGKPTEAVVKAAVKAANENPDATPDELVKTVVAAKPRPPKAVVPEAVAEIREERAEQAAKRDEITDDEWIAALPLASKLDGHALDKFRRDALDYRDLESTIPRGLTLRKAVAEFLSRTKTRQKGKVRHDGITARRADGLLSVEHPRSWNPCPSTEKGGCGGTGTIGSYGQCSMCYGRGYLPR